MASESATWRVYLQEWQIVHISDAHWEEGRQECQDLFAGKYQGRIRAEDCLVVKDGPWFLLKLRLFNLKGEFKDKPDADHLAYELFEPPAGCVPEVVQRGSAEEQALLDYGKKMLPDAG